MSFGSACEEWDAVNRARVLAQTFGHLDPKLYRTYRGSILFIKGGYRNVDGQMITHTFSFEGGPLFYEIAHDMLFKRLHNGGMWAELEDGVYRWDGTLLLRKAYHEFSDGLPAKLLSVR